VNLNDQDRLYFTIGSDRLHNNFQGWGLRAGEWREGGERMVACSIDWPKPSTATNNLKWTIPFNCPLLKSIMPLKEPADPAVANQATLPWKC